MSEVEEKTSGFIDSLGDAARRNPLSAALIGMGVLWLFAGKSTGRVGDVLRSIGLDGIPEATRDTFSSVKSGIGDSTAAASGRSRVFVRCGAREERGRGQPGGRIRPDNAKSCRRLRNRTR